MCFMVFLGGFVVCLGFFGVVDRNLVSPFFFFFCLEMFVILKIKPEDKAA